MKTKLFATFTRLLFTIGWLAAAGTAQAIESLLVTTLVDEDNGTSDALVGNGTSLREAIKYANSDGVDSVITFDSTRFAGPRKTILLDVPLPTLGNNGSVSISAPASGIEIDGRGSSRVVEVAAGAQATLTGLTIRNGNANSGNGNGGGILNNGTLTVNGCTLANNSATNGAAIYSATDLTANTLTVVNCTLTGNTATGKGGAIYNLSGLTRIQSCTIAGNTAPASAGAGVASTGNAATRTEILNSIVSQNGAAGATDVDFTDGATNSFVSGEYNLIGDGNATGAFTAFGDVTGNTNPGLDALADNGGPTPTRALLAGSPAINTGGHLFLDNDQRGVSRAQYAPDDKGAYELQATIPLFETLTVNTTLDEDNKTSDPRFGRGTSLREALAWSNRDGVNSTIVFDPVVFAAPRKTITLLGQQLPTLVWDGTITIPAPSAGLEVSGNNSSRVFATARATDDLPFADLTMIGLTIRNGYAIGTHGAGLHNRGPLHLDSCTFRDNVASSGSALHTERFSLIRNCTFSGNTATAGRGAIYIASVITIESCTITGNTGVGVYDETSLDPTTMKNCIVAGNTGSDVNFTQSGTFKKVDSHGYNLIGVGNGVAQFTAASDLTGVLKPDVLPLAENGGPTATCALLPTSPAVNSGQTDLTVDQRGVARPQPVGGVADRGAVEVSGVVDPALVVTTTADVVNPADGVVSLREAVARANSDGVASPIVFSETVFAAPRKRITLTGSPLSLGADGRITIKGPTAGVEISGGNASRVFATASGTDATITGLTIRDGNAGGGFGGGVLNLGTLELSSCTLTANSADSGAAIASDTDLSTRTLTLRNCTISGNAAASTGGGLFNTDGAAVIECCTITGNTAAAGQPGGIASFAGTNTRTEVRNSIVSGNGGAAVTDVGIVGTLANSFVSAGYNLIGDGNATAAFNQTGDVIGNTDPALNPLAENGGPTPTQLPIITSPAVNTGGTVLLRDARGIVRPQRARFDRGAAELDATAFIDSLVVTTLVDEDDSVSDPRFGTGTSLREAIDWANSDGVDSTITFDPVVFAAPRKTIVLGPKQLPTFVNNGTLTISGPPAGVELSGNVQTRVLQSGDIFLVPPSVTLTGLTISNGLPNAQSGDFERGGGILTYGPLVVDGCTFKGNTARFGGGIFAFEGAITIRNSTFTGNTCQLSGGAISGGSLLLENCTIAGNSSTGGFTAAGLSAFGNVVIRNCIIAGNNVGNPNAVDVTSTQGNIQSGGYNLVGEVRISGGNPSATFGAVGDQIIGAASPGVGPLQDNGGPTQTMALTLTSPALNAGNSNLTLDQRSVSRPRGTADDIGAFELIQLDIAPAGLAPGAVGQGYSESFAISGGTPPYNVALIGGSLPPGLAVTGGFISGTPLSGGNYSFTVRATGPLAAIGERSYSLAVGTISAPLAGDTAAWYRAEGNAQSFSGVAGTIGGTVGYAPGVVGQAFSFSGGAGYVALDPGLFPVPTTGNTSTAPFSFETWFSTTGSGIILGQQGSSIAPYGTALGTIPAIYVGTDGKLRVEMFWTGAINQVTSPAAVNDGNFHHLAAVFDGTNLIAYLDGVAIGTRLITQVGYSTSYFYQLGTGYSPGNRPSLSSGWINFTGLIDETAIYHRALSVADVQALWGAGSKGKSTVPAFTAFTRDGDEFTFGLKSWPNLNFQIEFSPTLLPADYQDIGASFTANPEGQTNASRTLPANSPTGFFRAYEVP